MRATRGLTNRRRSNATNGSPAMGARSASTTRAPDARAGESVRDVSAPIPADIADALEILRSVRPSKRSAPGRESYGMARFRRMPAPSAFSPDAPRPPFLTVSIPSARCASCHPIRTRIRRDAFSYAAPAERSASRNGARNDRRHCGGESVELRAVNQVPRHSAARAGGTRGACGRVSARAVHESGVNRSSGRGSR
jgi:hypothetical protein